MGESRIVTLVLCTGLAWLGFKLLRIGRRDKTLPPGPRTIPVLGNAHLIPSKFSFLRFAEWGRKYGGIYSIKVANATVIVLSDMRVVKELLDDRSSEMSSRPYIYVADILSNGEPCVESESEALSSHITRYALSSIIDFAFGKRVLQYDGPEMQDFQAYIRNFSKALSPESAPVDLIPPLRYIPDFMAPWMKLWNETRAQQQSLYFSFLRCTEQGLDSGSRERCIIQAILARREELGLTREMIAYIGGALIDAGTETISTLMQSLILCLAKNPRCLKKAQEEIDDLIGDKRLPIASDIDELPYIQALIKELLRSIAFDLFYPLAFHMRLSMTVMGDIPQSRSVSSNNLPVSYLTENTPELFERPDEFWPERYLLTPDGTIPGLDKDYTIRPNLPFGSGKNILVMRLIWAFDLGLKEGYASENNMTWSLEEEYMDGLTLSPKKFDIAVTPRSSVRAKMIEDSYMKVGDNGADDEVAERLRKSMTLDESWWIE
ncbi:Cytochrome P450 monooxygenase [Psilocybe cubensis]|uniref:Cytochrome P450 monooxygenase n=1 Tax=Psilocybe cubensis TaxID=181762 RepID=A0ACB8GM10_PSICU|nr:Cytochrome P450 monooxygenase [Psilocybe cubensis]KAH9476432.1 Cytochrome P450 monooxygenase [Psilocybe cubensis]